MSVSSILPAAKSWVSSLVAEIVYHAWTIFLFTKSDIKTTLIPVTCFAFGVGPLSRSNTLSHGLQAVLWFWIHLLAFNLSNQAREDSDAEDKCNKPWRPLPSGRISLENAITLKHVVVFLGLALSTHYGLPTVYASEGLWVACYAYHELELEKHVIWKSVSNGFGYGCLALGPIVVASETRSLDFIHILALLTIMTLIITTIHVQDFEDRVGDAQVGRRTLIILYPRFARYLTTATIIPWSYFLCTTWELDTPFFVAYMIFGISLCVRYHVKTTIRDDRVSYILYNLWLATAFGLPGYWRHFKEPMNSVKMPFSLDTLLSRTLSL